MKHTNLLKRNYRLLILGILLVIVGMIFYTFSPENSAFYPTCAFKEVTGLSCPGCGSQRAIHELLHLQFATAFYYNPLLFFGCFYGALILIFSNAPLKNRFPNFKKILTGKIAVILIGLLIIVFFILRNL